MSTFISNLDVYRAIAEEAAAESKRLLEAGRRPKPDGQPGYIVTYDPQRKSFKQSLIAIAFEGMYLEALFGLVGKQKLGKEGYRKIERRKYEAKLERLGVVDQGILDRCKRFREARNDLVHEDALDLDSSDPAVTRTAQKEAAFGIELVRSLARILRPGP